jgi:hypothetical protein
MQTKRQKMPVSICLDPKTRVELCKRAARETIRSGKTVTPSGLVRDLVEKALFGRELAATASE